MKLNVLLPSGGPSRNSTGPSTATPAPLLEYLDQKAREAEWLRTIPLELQGYYRDRVNDYFNNLDDTKPTLELQPER